MMNELSSIGEYLLMRWVKELEIRRLARYVVFSEAKKSKFPPASIAYELTADVSESFIFTVVEQRICIFLPSSVFFFLKYTAKEFVYDANSIYILFHIGVGDGVLRLEIHPDIVKSFNENNTDGRVLIGGVNKQGQDFLFEDVSEINIENLAESLFFGDAVPDESETEIDDCIMDVIDDHYFVSLIKKG
jgi:hypothetical protein